MSWSPPADPSGNPVHFCWEFGKDIDGIALLETGVFF